MGAWLERAIQSTPFRNCKNCNHLAATAAITKGITMDYSTYDVGCLSLCYEWFGYTYHLDGDSQQVNADLEEQESAS